MLIALRSWAPEFRNRRMRLAVRTDNIATLSLVARMQPHSPTLGVIAREMALDIAGLSYAPDTVRHIPGIANVSADALSHRFEPYSKA